MLYDNAQLLELLALAHALGRIRYTRIAPVKPSAGCMAEMWGRAAFAASEDADSEGEEGRFYVWTEAEVDALLGGRRCFKDAYDVTRGGNWEGHTILRRMTPIGVPDEEAGLARSRAVLFAAPCKRVRAGP